MAKMAGRCVSAPLALASSFTSALVGLTGADAATDGRSGSGPLAYASAIATAARAKILEYSGAEADSRLPLLVVGAGGAVLAAFTLYFLTVAFDKDPFTFNGGKMGKLEAQSVYLSKKKSS